MKINCLTYLLDLWQRGHRFTILYNGDHCTGVNSKKVFELSSTFKDDLVRGYSEFGSNKYSPIETWHSKETIIKIFNLTKEQASIIKEYYERK